MRPRGEIDDGTPILPTKFYRPSNLLYKISFFGDFEAFEAACVRGQHKGLSFPRLPWNHTQRPAPTLATSSELGVQRRGRLGHLDVGIESALKPLIIYLRTTTLPFRPIRHEEILADVELLQGYRLVTPDVPRGVIASLAGSSFIPSIVQRFVATFIDDSLPFQGACSPQSLKENYANLLQVVRSNIQAALQKGHIKPQQAAEWEKDIHKHPLPGHLLDPAFWYAMNNGPAARPEVPSGSGPPPQWKPLYAATLGGYGAAIIWEPQIFLQQLLLQWSSPLSLLVKATMMQPNNDQVRAACLTVEQIFAQFADSHIIRSISVVTAFASMQTPVDVLYLGLLLLILTWGSLPSRGLLVTFHLLHAAGS